MNTKQLLRLLIAVGLVVLVAATVTRVPSSPVKAQSSTSQSTQTSPSQSTQTSNNTWIIQDVIAPSLDQVDWTESGAIETPASWIADGAWTIASMRESLISQNDIFVSLFEEFVWSKVQPLAESYYGTTFNSYGDFAQAIQANTGPWLNNTWQIDPQWYGVSQNTTRVFISYNATSDLVDLSIWCHITCVPEYLCGNDELTNYNWLNGFDLTPISVGNMKLWELWEDWTQNGTAYELRFEAPADILTQNANNYTCSIGVDPVLTNQPSSVDQIIEIEMPPATVAQQLTPQTVAWLQPSKGTNDGWFYLSQGELYPDAYTVVSAPPTQTAFQVLSGVLTTPYELLSILSIAGVLYGALQGRNILQRNGLYNRLYRTMVKLYNLYNGDLPRFHAEMDGVSKNIFKVAVEGKINDEQFEKLLTRRDDLLERAEKQQAPPPNKTLLPS